MSIIPIQTGISSYLPSLPWAYSHAAYLPTLYQPSYMYPSVYNNYPLSLSGQSYTSPTNQYTPRILSYYDVYYQATYNPGNFWLWPPGK